MEYIIERPVENFELKSQRARVWFWRSRAAYDLAERMTGKNRVTIEAQKNARKILASIERYALKDVRHFENENNSERFANSEYCQKEAQQLEKRRENLQKVLYQYGCYMVNYGLYPTIKDARTERDLDLLFWF